MKYQTDHSPFRVNVGAVGTQRTGDVTALEGGGFVAVWADQGANFSNNVIRARLIGADGVPATTDFVVNKPDDAIIQGTPAVAALDGGGFVVAWRDHLVGILSQRFDAAGKAVGAKLRINDANEAYQREPTVTAVAGGGYAVAWEGRIAGESDRANVFTQLVRSNGTMAGEVKVTASTGVTGAQNAAVAKFGAGFVLTWQEDAAGTAGMAVKAQFFSASGAKQGTAITLDTAGSFAGSASITALKDGGFAAAWMTSEGVGKYSVEAKAFDSGGKALGNAVEVAAGGGNYVGIPDIAAQPDGGFTVAWQVYDKARDADVFARSFGADGKASGEAFRLNSATVGSQDGVEIAVNKNGRLFATWTDMNGTESDVRGQDFKSDFAPPAKLQLTGDLSDLIAYKGTHKLTAGDLGTAGAEGSVTYKVSDVKNGTVTVSGTVARSFTQADLDAGHVAFKQQGTEKTSSFKVSATDGGETTAAKTFSLQVVNAKPTNLRYDGPHQDTPTLLIEVNADKDADADMLIVLTGIRSVLGAEDFIF